MNALFIIACLETCGILDADFISVARKGVCWCFDGTEKFMTPAYVLESQDECGIYAYENDNESVE